jgi:hypothetical protein
MTVSPETFDVRRKHFRSGVIIDAATSRLWGRLDGPQIKQRLGSQTRRHTTGSLRGFRIDPIFAHHQRAASISTYGHSQPAGMVAILGTCRPRWSRIYCGSTPIPQTSLAIYSPAAALPLM